MKKLLCLLLCVIFTFSCGENKQDNKEETSNNLSIIDLINISKEQNLTKEETLKLLENQFNKEYVTIQPGERGVMYYPFEGGLDLTKTYKQGEHLLSPWNKMIIYNVKKQTLSQKVAGKDINEIQCTLDMSVIYHPYPEEIGLLDRKVGPGYASSIIKPTLKDIALSVISKYTYDDIISSKKDVVKDDIQMMMMNSLIEYHININEILINDIIISPEIERAIQKKVEAEQLALKQKYVIEKEKQEKKMKD